MRKLKGAVYYAKRVAAKLRVDSKTRLDRQKEIRRLQADHIVETYRSFFQYKALLERALPNRDLLKTLVQMKRRRPLRILDEGAGEGWALAELKQKLSEAGVKSEATALTLDRNPVLTKMQAKGEIDKVLEGSAEFFVPEKPFDLILSVFGSVSYTMPSARKDHLLKFANSLAKGGVMLVAFQIDLKQESVWGFSFGRKRPIDAEKLSNAQKKKVKNTVLRDLYGIMKALQKRGFEANFITPQNIFKKTTTTLYIRKK